MQRLEYSPCLVNLKTLGLRAGDKMAVAFFHEGGNQLPSNEALYRPDHIAFHKHDAWWTLDLSGLDLSAFTTDITLLPLPLHIKRDDLVGIGRQMGLQCYTLPRSF